MVEFQMAGRVALVTGGGSGIGRAIARGLLGAGVDVGIAELDPDRVTRFLEEAREFSARAAGAAGNAGVATDVERIVQVVTQQLGPIDILFNCAGIFPRSNVAEMSEEEWDRVMTTNLKSVFLMSRAVLPSMLERKHGRIVTITSGLGTTGVARGSHYSATKGAINGFTRSLAREVMNDGIMVNAIAPGLTDTPMMRGANTPEYIASLTAQMPGGKLGDPEDVVGMALYLASDGAKDVCGQVLGLRG
ncbi:MAG: SDR family oxidoreductase [Chloroflexi bacterium]|nr:SDR family oxidoreductase [Chloroflexota bacterium]